MAGDESSERGKLVPFFAFMDEYPGRHAALGRQRPNEHLPCYPLASRCARTENNHQLDRSPQNVQWRKSPHQPTYNLFMGEKERWARERLADLTSQKFPRWKAALDRAEQARRQKDAQVRILLERKAREAEATEIGARIRQVEEELYKAYAGWRTEAATLTGKKTRAALVWESFGVQFGKAPMSIAPAESYNGDSATSSAWSYGGPNVLDESLCARDVKKRVVNDYSHIGTKNTVLPPYACNQPLAPLSPSQCADAAATSTHHGVLSGTPVLAPPLFTARPLSRKERHSISPVIIGEPLSSVQDWTEDLHALDISPSQIYTRRHTTQRRTKAVTRRRRIAPVTAVQDELSGRRDKCAFVAAGRGTGLGTEERGESVRDQEELSKTVEEESRNLK